MKIKKGEVYRWVRSSKAEQHYKIIKVEEKVVLIKRVDQRIRYKRNQEYRCNKETFIEVIKDEELIKMPKLKSRLLYE